MIDRNCAPWIGLVMLLATACQPCRAEDEVRRHLQTIGRAGPQAAYSAQARRASQALAEKGIRILPPLLDAMDTPNVVAANWYRTVYQRIVAHEQAAPEPRFPVDQLKQYVRNPARQGRARRLVLRLLEQLEPGFRAQLLPTLLEDVEFREDAVADLLQQADQASALQRNEQAIAIYRQAFEHARDSGQVTRAADRLKSLGVEVQIVQHMGFVTRWYLLGPFDAPETSGFNRVFPPESQVDLSAVYSGKDGSKIRWKLYETPDRLGQLNLIQAISPVKEAVGYAYTIVHSPKDQDVQLRCGADDNLSVWLNGEKIFARQQWLNGTRLDRFVAPAHLKAGENHVLVKICQGPQHKNPAVPNNWSLQLRFCDQSGGGLGLRPLLPEAENGQEQER